jgi:formate--tetrahydrofolate ligase
MASLAADYEIAKKATMKPVAEIAKICGIDAQYLDLYGTYKAKVKLDVLKSLDKRPLGKYVVVTAITPTPLGEGKTVNTIGLSLGLNRIGKKAICCTRQPSLGPVFGVKGGAAGGGYSQVLPMEDINIHLTGDIHAVQAAHNLGSAFLDNHLHFKNRLGIDTGGIFWRRVMDMNDRALRNIAVGQKGEGVERGDGFDIAVASEIMAVLALSNSYKDMRARLGRMIMARTKDGKPVTAEDLKVAGAMALLVRDALKPNLLQTIEGTPAFIHTGPFGNIAHGNSSILADFIALRCGEFVVTEAGFGADLGFEKFVDIKCRTSGLKPDAAMIVATVRGLKSHSGKFKIVTGKPLPENLLKEDLDSLRSGAENLAKMVSIVTGTGIPAVVAVNRFPTDTDKEIDEIRKIAKDAGADAEVSEAFAKGGEGMKDLAKAVVKATEKKSNFKYYYESGATLKEKIEAVATKVYGADGVDYSPLAEEKLNQFTEWGLGKLSVCLAKTQLSVSHDPELKGRPKGFRLPIVDVRASAGAGFVFPLCGSIMTMPGLSASPAGELMDIDENGGIVGLTGKEK